jgi:hypothetical protein
MAWRIAGPALAPGLLEVRADTRQGFPGDLGHQRVFDRGENRLCTGLQGVGFRLGEEPVDARALNRRLT